MKHLLILATALCLCLTGASLAEAHAFLSHSDPKVGSTVKSSPAEIKIWFTDELQGALSSIEVLDPDGHEVDKKDAKVDPSDDGIMSVSVPKLAPGTYKVQWHAVCRLGHDTSGSFTFKVTGA